MKFLDGIIILSACLLGLHFVDGFGEYYWRDYDGGIPIDSLALDSDTDGPLYIGQGLCADGLSNGRITNGILEIPVPCGTGMNTKVVKILCTLNHSNFHWLAVNSSAYHLDIAGKNPVIGGFNLAITDGYLHIGRLLVGGVYTIGHINSYSATPYFYYLNGTGSTTSTTTLFDVLTYGVD